MEQSMVEDGAAAEKWPPGGYLSVADAAARMGISLATFFVWRTTGRLGYAGERVRRNGSWWLLFSVAEVDRAYQAMKQAEGDPADSIEAASVWPPAGFVDRGEAAQRCGVNAQAFRYLERQGRLPGARLVKMPGSRARASIYPEEEVRRVAEEIRAAEQAPFPPPGFVDRYQAAAMFEMHVSQFELWERLGRIRCASKTAKGPNGGMANIYAIADVERAKAQVAAEDAAAGARVVVSAPAGYQIPMSRILLGLEGRQWKISHANGDALDCRRSNLVVRDQTHTNAHARKRRTTQGGKPCTSRFKGVCWIEAKGNWLAGIQKEGNHRRLGYFDDEIAAAEAYDEAARELFGEHARPNFPDGIDQALNREAA